VGKEKGWFQRARDPYTTRAGEVETKTLGIKKMFFRQGWRGLQERKTLGNTWGKKKRSSAESFHSSEEIEREGVLVLARFKI